MTSSPVIKKIAAAVSSQNNTIISFYYWSNILLLLLLLLLCQQHNNVNSFANSPPFFFNNERRGSITSDVVLRLLRNNNVMSPSPLRQPQEEKKNTTINNTIDIATIRASSTTKRQYDWKDFSPNSKNVGLFKILRWIITGASQYAKQSDKAMQSNLSSLARMLLLLREYERRYYRMLPSDEELCGPAVQRQVLAEITKDLYGSGTPTWVLETVMERVAEGMTGREGVQLLLLPNVCFIVYPAAASSASASSSSSSSTTTSTTTSSSSGATTDMFRISPGFDISRMGAVEQVAVRLASFASNTKSAERLHAAAFRGPRPKELAQIQHQETAAVAEYLQNNEQQPPGPEALAKEILDLASSTYGLFFFLNSPKFQTAINATDPDDVFWEVPYSTRELFTRLATHEAAQSLGRLRQISAAEQRQPLYPNLVVSLFRAFSSAGAAAIWFGGSIPDMLVSGLLAVSVAYIETAQASAFEERVLTEVVASFFVGLCAGLLSIRWPNQFCFGAIAMASVMGLMQGFKVVFSVMEVMSKNLVTGSARLLQGILFTGLISYSLKFGLAIAFRIMFGTSSASDIVYADIINSVHGISHKWFPLILPFAATAWSGLFRPSYEDLPLMACHGMLAFSLNYAGAPMFLAAMCVTFSAGIISRFTGREALGNTLAGLYALVPGTYMVRALLSPDRVGFVENVLFNAGSIGLGGWTGTILCSPTILGKSSGLHGWALNRRGKKKQQAMLFF